MFVKSQELPLLVESTESFESFFFFPFSHFYFAGHYVAHHSLHPPVGFTS